VSHELRTPLNAVLGFAQLLQRDSADLELDARRQGYLQRICEAGSHLKRLIEEVLELSRNEARSYRIELSPVELRSLISEAVEMVAVDPRAQQISIRFEGARAAPLYVLADGLRLREIIWNLLTNAVKYNRPHGEIEVTLSQAGPQRASIRVRDTGLGIDAVAMAHLFEPFNRLGRAQSNIEGVGIGLAVSRGFAERMGGELLAESELGVGSTFELLLQSCEAPTVAVLASQSAQAQPVLPTQAPLEQPRLEQPRLEQPVAPASGTVVYIEDNALNRLLLEEYALARPGLELVSAVSGEEGIELVRQLRPDLALVDLHLPDMTGFDVLARLKAEGCLPALGCIALSADATPERIEEAREAGFADYWTKPILPEAFLSGLDRVMD
jgi:hypothetical protein